MRLNLTICALALPLVAGCVDSPAEPPAPDTCGLADLEGLVGLEANAALDTFITGPDVRVIEPGMAVTMDYRADRANIWIGENGKIERVTCG